MELLTHVCSAALLSLDAPCDQTPGRWSAQTTLTLACCRLAGKEKSNPLFGDQSNCVHSISHSHTYRSSTKLTRRQWAQAITYTTSIMNMAVDITFSVRTITRLPYGLFDSALTAASRVKSGAVQSLNMVCYMTFGRF